MTAETQRAPLARRLADAVVDAAGLGGAGLVTGGVWQLSHPWGLIIGGGFLLAFAWLTGRKGGV